MELEQVPHLVAHRVLVLQVGLGQLLRHGELQHLVRGRVRVRGRVSVRDRGRVCFCVIASCSTWLGLG